MRKSLRRFKIKTHQSSTKLISTDATHCYASKFSPMTTM